jgi:hypothetical protein
MHDESFGEFLLVLLLLTGILPILALVGGVILSLLIAGVMLLF